LHLLLLLVLVFTLVLVSSLLVLVQVLVLVLVRPEALLHGLSLDGRARAQQQAQRHLIQLLWGEA
jgi:hypothetical protein